MDNCRADRQKPDTETGPRGRFFPKGTGRVCRFPVDFSLFCRNLLIVERKSSTVLPEYPRFTLFFPRKRLFSPHRHFLASLLISLSNSLKRKKNIQGKVGKSGKPASTGLWHTLKNHPRFQLRKIAFPWKPVDVFSYALQPLNGNPGGIHHPRVVLPPPPPRSLFSVHLRTLGEPYQWTS